MMVTAFGGDNTLAAATDRHEQLTEEIMHIEFDGEDAVAERASALRVALDRWLAELDVNPDRAYDVVLASYEAMANAVEHAYEANGKPGTLDLHAQCVPSTGWVEVTVSDHGEWAVHPPDSTRGRGVPLMHALADTTAVEVGSDGSGVRQGVHERDASAAGRIGRMHCPLAVVRHGHFDLDGTTVRMVWNALATA